MIKAIFFDVDGTLLSHRTGRISPHTRACIRALRAGGTLVFLSTGRHILELRSLPVGEMAFDGYITLNGQQPTAALRYSAAAASRAGAGRPILCGWPAPRPGGGGTHLH